MLAAALQKISASVDWPDGPGKAFVACAAIAGVAASIAIAPNAGGVLAAGLALTVVAIAAIDARYFIIPDALSVAALALGLVHAAVVDYPATEAIALAVLRGVVLALLFLAVRAAYQALRGRQGIGLGDVKLAAVAGVWVDWQMMAVVVNIAALAALAVYAIRQFALGRSIRATGRLPFGLFLAPAIWFGWMLDVWLLAPGYAPGYAP